jgi:hypothetical protein
MIQKNLLASFPYLVFSVSTVASDPDHVGRRRLNSHYLILPGHVRFVKKNSAGTTLDGKSQASGIVIQGGRKMNRVFSKLRSMVVSCQPRLT